MLDRLKKQWETHALDLQNLFKQCEELATQLKAPPEHSQSSSRPNKQRLLEEIQNIAIKLEKVYPKKLQYFISLLKTAQIPASDEQQKNNLIEEIKKQQLFCLDHTIQANLLIFKDQFDTLILDENFRETLPETNLDVYISEKAKMERVKEMITRLNKEFSPALTNSYKQLSALAQNSEEGELIKIRLKEIKKNIYFCIYYEINLQHILLKIDIRKAQTNRHIPRQKRIDELSTFYPNIVIAWTKLQRHQDKLKQLFPEDQTQIPKLIENISLDRLVFFVLTLDELNPEKLSDPKVKNLVKEAYRNRVPLRAYQLFEDAFKTAQKNEDQLTQYELKRAQAYQQYKLITDFKVHHKGTTMMEVAKCITSAYQQALDLVPDLKMDNSSRFSLVETLSGELSFVIYQMTHLGYNYSKFPQADPSQWFAETEKLIHIGKTLSKPSAFKCFHSQFAAAEKDLVKIKEEVATLKQKEAEEKALRQEQDAEVAKARKEYEAEVEKAREEYEAQLLKEKSLRQAQAQKKANLSISPDSQEIRTLPDCQEEEFLELQVESLTQDRPIRLKAKPVVYNPQQLEKELARAEKNRNTFAQIQLNYKLADYHRLAFFLQTQVNEAIKHLRNNNAYLKKTLSLLEEWQPIHKAETIEKKVKSIQLRAKRILNEMTGQLEKLLAKQEAKLAYQNKCRQQAMESIVEKYGYTAWFKDTPFDWNNLSPKAKARLINLDDILDMIQLKNNFQNLSSFAPEKSKDKSEPLSEQTKPSQKSTAALPAKKEQEVAPQISVPSTQNWAAVVQRSETSQSTASSVSQTKSEQYTQKPAQSSWVGIVAAPKKEAPIKILQRPTQSTIPSNQKTQPSTHLSSQKQSIGLDALERCDRKRDFIREDMGRKKKRLSGDSFFQPRKEEERRAKLEGGGRGPTPDSFSPSVAEEFRTAKP